ncbi:hypothetical protein UFOVP1020_20 [uncultured Caudovirales phage]|uniref:Uncharacterized protein n=1 Tax=uncultured Caudovirales phage TaxID=2100421 RepID=A0A6J5MP41_9CAUD|nr:hypothetical protein UFOVP512_25 [uncultured Caudovirales phage]CAB4178679.1 hypothetical protein UFOVP1020_20 [uncultured Caudovirales phage]CAB4187918.1 hypothetical protein UFOVP1170_15 [uncultured Caudovirales phage]CAB4220432.1 hypothetical protein UFOVP1621_30 [uncultured Caudovirales phage]
MARAAAVIAVWVIQIAYIAVCLAGMFAIFALQRGRHRCACALLWWTYTALAAALAWEAIDAWQYAPPGWPASRWILIPALVTVLIWAAVNDRRGRYENKSAGP